MRRCPGDPRVYPAASTVLHQLRCCFGNCCAMVCAKRLGFADTVHSCIPAQIFREVKSLATLDHPGIIRYYQVHTRDRRRLTLRGLAQPACPGAAPALVDLWARQSARP